MRKVGDRSPYHTNTKKQGTVTEKHPLLGQHVVLGAMRPDFKYEIEDQVSRLLKMSSSQSDPEFWKVIQWGRIGLEDGYVAVRKLIIGDPIRFVYMSLWDGNLMKGGE